MALMDKFAPKPSGVRDPRDPNKKNGMFWNWPRYLYLGGVPQKFPSAGNKGPKHGADPGEYAVGPISDRGKGRR